MVARVARFEGVNVAEAERTLGEAEAVIRPLIESLAGYAGHVELLSAGGDVLSITLFDSDDNAAAAERTSTRRCRAVSATSSRAGRAVASRSTATTRSPTSAASPACGKPRSAGLSVQTHAHEIDPLGSPTADPSSGTVFSECRRVSTLFNATTKREQVLAASRTRSDSRRRSPALAATSSLRRSRPS